MTPFHRAVRSLMKDVESFLIVTLKNVKLRKDARDLKAAILSRIDEMKTEFPQQLTEQVVIEPNQGQLERGHSSEHLGKSDNVSVNPYGSADGSFVGDSSYIMAVAAKDITEPDIAGFLKKQKQKALTYTQKRWCVVKGGILYYFASKSSKVPNGYVILAGYEARPSPDTKKKNCAFELVQPEMRTWHFLAGSAEEVTKWILVLNSVSGHADRDLIAKTSGQLTDRRPPGEEHQGFEDRWPLPFDSADRLSGDASEMYGNTPQGSSSSTSRAAQVSVETCPDLYDEGCSSTCIVGDVYDNAEIVQASILAETHDEAQPSLEEPGQIYDDGESGLPQEEDIYDDCDNMLEEMVNERPWTQKGTPAVPIIIPPGKVCTLPPSWRAPLAPSCSLLEPEPLPDPPCTVPHTEDSPSVVEMRMSNEEEPDYENLYLAMWDCNAEEQNELSFKRGDMVHVVGRQYEAYSWWVAELNGRRGLVPNNFLMQAYELVE